MQACGRRGAVLHQVADASAVAGGITFLLWIWIGNVALLFGAELGSEIERARELVSGIEADEAIRLPLKSNKAILKAQEATAADILRRGGAPTGTARLRT